MTAAKLTNDSSQRKQDSSKTKKMTAAIIREMEVTLGPLGPGLSLPWAFSGPILFVPPLGPQLVPTLGPFLGLSMDRSCFNHDPILSLMTGPPRIIALHELRG